MLYINFVNVNLDSAYTSNNLPNDIFISILHQNYQSYIIIKKTHIKNTLDTKLLYYDTRGFLYTYIKCKTDLYTQL